LLNPNKYKNQFLSLVRVTILCVFLPLCLFSNNTYEISTGKGIEVRNYSLFEISNEATFSLEAISSSKEVAKENSVLFTEANTSQVLLFEICNSGNSQQSRFLNFNSIDYSSIVAYTYDQNGTLQLIDKIGYDHAYHERKFVNSRPIFEFLVQPENCIDIYLHIKQKFLPVNSKMFLDTSKELANRIEDNAFTGGINIGIIFTYLAIALIFILFFRDPQNKYYVIYILGNALYVLYSRANSFAYAVLSDNYLDYLFFCAPFISICIASYGFSGLFQHFFNLKHRNKNLNRFFNFLRYSYIFFLTGLLFWPWLTELNQNLLIYWIMLIAIWMITAIVSAVISGLYLYKKSKNNYHLIFILNFTPSFLFILVMWGMEAQYFEKSDLLYENGAMIVIMIEAIIIGSLLAYRTHQEKLSYQRNIISERKQIVDDLHSGLMPEIEILSLLNQQEIKPLNEKLSITIDELQNDIREDIRSLMWVLNTHQFYYLYQTLTKLRNVVQSRLQHTNISFQVNSSPILIPEKVKITFLINYHLYQIVKESVNNTAKHSNANNFSLEVNYHPNQLSINLSDDGDGFDLEEELATSSTNKRGLREFHSRAEKMNAYIKIETSKNCGFKLQLVIPLKETLNH